MTEAAIAYEYHGDPEFQKKISDPQRLLDREERIIENLCDELHSAKLILGDRRFSFPEKLGALSTRLQELQGLVERIET